jgi:hypothetical protein|tara:strand:+ start:45 stop:215 length:171 start_codon:yes stop_codon:yes gene_type:complete
MIRNILDQLEFAKLTKARGDLIDIALGKNKIPESFKEVIQLTILKHGRKNKHRARS